MTVKKASALVPRLLLSLAAITTLPSAMADTPETFTAQIDSILLYEAGNVVYVYPHGGLPNPPACQTNGPYVSFSMSRPMAKEYLAALLAAQMSGKSVYFRTTGACNDQGVSDTLAYFKVNS